MNSPKSPALALCAALAAMTIGALPAMAQDGPLRIEITDGVTEPMAVAIPAFLGDSPLAAEIAAVVADDLTGTDLFRAIPADAYLSTPASLDDPVAWADWRALHAQALIVAEVTEAESGAVAAETMPSPIPAAAPQPAEGATDGGDGDGGTVTVRFRIYDVFAGQPLGDGIQLDAARDDWRRLAHKLADQVYQRLTGEAPYFDSRVAFIQESGPKDARLTRLGVMDYDGASVDWLTDDAALVLSPAMAPDGDSIIYTSFETGFPQLVVMDVASVTARPLTNGGDSMAFSPRFSPDGRWVLYSLESRGNSDIWQMDAASGASRPMFQSPAIETAPDYSPDGSQIVFESDRSGSPQLYVAPADGSAEPVRISFGDGRYGAPVWSPLGDLIAFTRRNGDAFHIGIMRPDGSGEQMLTESFLDEGPSWAPNGRVVMFTRVTPGGDGEPRLHSVDITGRNMRPLDLDFAASDPSWGPLLP